MRTFKISEKIEIVCDSKRTRNGFKHEATLLINGQEQNMVKVCYLNRTWERYEYQTVMEKLINKTTMLNQEEIKICKEFIEGDHTDWTPFKTTAAVAKLGELFCDNKKDRNDWKVRMLKAGLQGINIPEDWDSLNEEDKEKRLNNVIALCKTTG